MWCYGALCNSSVLIDTLLDSFVYAYNQGKVKLCLLLKSYVSHYLGVSMHLESVTPRC